MEKERSGMLATPYDNTTRMFSMTNIKPGAEVTTEQLQQCSDLFSSAYGIWSAQGRRPHRHVTVSARRLKLDYLFNPKTCGIVVAKDLKKECLVGQAFYVKYPYSMDKEVIWITQLVVREDHRHKGVATSMIRKCLMDHPDVWACGLVSCHPYAVKALESATQSSCNRSLSAQHAEGLIERSGIPYVQNCQPCISATKCAIQTHFHVDHGAVDRASADLEDWLLGRLEPGEEYFAFTYNLQEQQLEWS